MTDVEIISKISSIVRSGKNFWVEGEYSRNQETVHWECFIQLLEGVVAVGFDKYLKKYEDAVDLYDAYVRSKFSDVELAVVYVLGSFPLAAEKMRQK